MTCRVFEAVKKLQTKLNGVEDTGSDVKIDGKLGLNTQTKLVAVALADRAEAIESEMSHPLVQPFTSTEALKSALKNTGPIAIKDFLVGYGFSASEVTDIQASWEDCFVPAAAGAGKPPPALVGQDTSLPLPGGGSTLLFPQAPLSASTVAPWKWVVGGLVAVGLVGLAWMAMKKGAATSTSGCKCKE